MPSHSIKLILQLILIQLPIMKLQSFITVALICSFSFSFAQEKSIQKYTANPESILKKPLTFESVKTEKAVELKIKSQFEKKTFRKEIIGTEPKK